MEAGSAEHPRSAASNWQRVLDCRHFFALVEKLGHTVVFTSEGLEEWQRHRNQATFARGWLTRMYGRRQVHRLAPTEKAGVRESLRSRVIAIAATKDEHEQREIVKDIHLLEAALATDNLVVSSERRARAFYAASSATVKELRLVVWVRLGKPERATKHTDWMMDGAEVEQWLEEIGSGEGRRRELMLGHAVEEQP